MAKKMRRLGRVRRRDPAALLAVLCWCLLSNTYTSTSTSTTLLVVSAAETFTGSTSLRGTTNGRRGKHRIRKSRRLKGGAEKKARTVRDQTHHKLTRNNIFFRGKENDVTSDRNPAENLDRTPEANHVSPYELGADGYGYILGNEEEHHDPARESGFKKDLHSFQPRQGDITESAAETSLKTRQGDIADIGAKKSLQTKGATSSNARKGDAPPQDRFFGDMTNYSTPFIKETIGKKAIETTEGDGPQARTGPQPKRRGGTAKTATKAAAKVEAKEKTQKTTIAEKKTAPQKRGGPPETPLPPNPETPPVAPPSMPDTPPETTLFRQPLPPPKPETPSVAPSVAPSNMVETSPVTPPTKVETPPATPLPRQETPVTAPPKPETQPVAPPTKPEIPPVAPPPPRQETPSPKPVPPETNFLESFTPSPVTPSKVPTIGGVKGETAAAVTGSPEPQLWWQATAVPNAKGLTTNKATKKGPEEDSKGRKGDTTLGQVKKGVAAETPKERIPDNNFSPETTDKTIVKAKAYRAALPEEFPVKPDPKWGKMLIGSNKSTKKGKKAAKKGQRPPDGRTADGDGGDEPKHIYKGDQKFLVQTGPRPPQVEDRDYPLHGYSSWRNSPGRAASLARQKPRSYLYPPKKVPADPQAEMIRSAAKLTKSRYDNELVGP